LQRAPRGIYFSRAESSESQHGRTNGAWLCWADWRSRAVGRPGHGAVRTGPQTKRAPRDRNREALHQAPRVQEGPERSTEAVAGSVEEDGGWMAGWLDGSTLIDGPRTIASGALARRSTGTRGGARALSARARPTALHQPCEEAGAQVPNRAGASARARAHDLVRGTVVRGSASARSNFRQRA
jgi:hypothetical protein